MTPSIEPDGLEYNPNEEKSQAGRGDAPKFLS
jgi:hypothetical protein